MSETTSEAMIALEDGRVFTGRSFGAPGERCGEVVFNTSMTGYQEILTDPSYAAQIVTMTYPLIGNYGVNAEDSESGRIQVEGLVVRECCRRPSNWRASHSLPDYLKAHGILGIEGVDTRALTLHIRTAGAMKAAVSTLGRGPDALVAMARHWEGLIGRDLVKHVTCPEPYRWHGERATQRAARPPEGGTPNGDGQAGRPPEGGTPNGAGDPRRPPEGGTTNADRARGAGSSRFRVVAYDFGCKRNILRLLAAAGCDVTVVPAATPADAALALDPDGILLSNGPGDPEGVPHVVREVRKLLDRRPIFGICLGQQILGLALGGRTYKLKFGHRGANHPVKELATGRVDITSQNHGFCVDLDSLPPADVEITHLNLNDGTLEGFRHRHLPIFCVQYHPEASPGPHDAALLFARFTDLMARHSRPAN